MSSVAGIASAPREVGRRGGRFLRSLTLLAAVAGLAVVGALLWRIGPATVAGVILRAGWWLPLVVLLHLPQTAASAAGWGALIEGRERPAFPRLYLFRWIRESVNTLLPVAQIGGEVVRARLLGRRDFGIARAGASCALDVTLELFAQIGFTLVGLMLLAVARPGSPLIGEIGMASAALAALVAALMLVLRLTRSPRLQALAAGWLRRERSRGGEPFRADAGQKARSTVWHFASWMLGALETWAALRAVGVHAGPAEALVVESLSQMLRVAAFAVPGALGVQEGGLILICGLFGVAPASALGVSLVRRLREVGLGAPGLWAWRHAERLPTVGGVA